MTPLKLSVPLPDVLHESGGEIRVKGSRITLYDIVTAHDERWIGAHAMVFHYPTLSLDEIQRVLAFYHANQAAVQEYVRQYTAEIEQQRAAGKQLDVGELRRRLAAKESEAAANGKPATAPNVPASS